MTGGAFVDRLEGGAGRDGLTRGGGADTLIGGAAADTLSGGAGVDQLEGGTGADMFNFVTAPVAGEVDDIDDFAVGVDMIRLAASAFAGVSAGHLGAANFVSGTVAGDATDRVLYDKATGEIWFDSDGTGSAVAVLFARVTAGMALGAADFLIF